MIVIGLDGATWDIIKPNIDFLPILKQLIGKYSHCTLECDVRPVHSAPSWSTIFTGLKPEQHGIVNFVTDSKKREELLSKKLFIWDKAKHGIAMCIPVALPPLNHNYELRNWESVTLSVTEEEMYKSTERLLRDTIAALEYGEPDLLAVVFPEPDRVQHIFWHKQEIVLKHYINIDKALEKLLPYFEKNDFLILSDHGFTSAEETRKNGWDHVRDNQTGGHHPNGIAIAKRNPPTKVSQVYEFIERGLASL